MSRIRRALVSVSDPTGLDELARALHGHGIEIVASSGTGARIEAAGVPWTPLDEVTGAPENHLLAAISAAMGRFYGLPSGSWVSTESMAADAQAALEKGIGFLTHLQSGVNLVWGVGQVESELTLCPAQAVIDNEVLGYAERYLRGVGTDADSLAEEVIRSVGIAGNYLGEEHTTRHMRSELFEPGLLFRRRRADWAAAGSRTLEQAAEARADELIAAERPPALTEDQRKALIEIEQSVG